MDDPDPQDRPLRVIHLCYADAPGGAAIGARRAHQAMLKHGVDSRLVVVLKSTDDPRVISLPKRRLRRFLARRGAWLINKSRRSRNPVIRTFNVVPMGAVDILNRMEGDIVQMHWIGEDTISIGELAKLNKPIAWKLPDMWGFSGTEHYLVPGDPERYREGYIKGNRPAHEWGPDFDKLVWNYKRRAWRDTEFNIIGPSKWITDCAKDSQLFGHYRIRHILNPVDTDLYAPQDKQAARKALGLPVNKSIVMFGALNSTSDRRKGFHHLQAALEHLSNYLDPAETVLAILGADGPARDEIAGFACWYLGTIKDESGLVAAYNTADVFVLPTEADNLPNTIKEASCCGVACVGFNVGGMSDMIDHLETGYLAKPFEAHDLAKGIAWAAKHTGPELSAEIRRRAVARHAQGHVVEQYLDFYQEILSARERGTSRPGK
ncbi:MAG: glycosyltransferase [Methyloceanibacter sp.]|nr:glycosyltransferase [Methyloceanibacter sp.]